eukprot:6563210-Prymnesium_polylepis.2
MQPLSPGARRKGKVSASRRVLTKVGGARSRTRHARTDTARGERSAVGKKCVCVSRASGPVP